MACYAVLQAVHVLNTVTVPMGEQRATDSGKGEGQGDHTMWGAIYDHAPTPTLYYRTSSNHNLLAVPLAELPLAPGDAPRRLPLSAATLPWFVDVAAHFMA
jgi:penicillin V acylase-like amidase (Ntn superfamily)